MNKTQKTMSLTFKIFLGLTIANLALFFILFLAFGVLAGNTTDPDIKGGIGDVFKYHFSDMGSLFTFNFHEASNIVYFSLSGILYFFIFIAVLYLIVGILLIFKRHKPIIFFGIAASLIVVFVYLLAASGLPKYWAIINKRAPFDNDGSLVGPTFGILLFGFLYILTAYILYFASLFVALKSPKNSEGKIDDQDEESSEKEEQENVPQPMPSYASQQASNLDEQPVVFEEVDPQTIEQEKAEEKPVENVAEKVEEKDDLKSLLKEVVRDIVRDEIARNNANQMKQDSAQNSNGVPITGASFGGPLVVQYFNGGTTPTVSVPQPVKEAPKSVQKEPQPEPVKEAVETVKEEPIAEPIKEEKPKEKEPEVSSEKKPIIRIPFTTRMLDADKEMQDNYNELKNEIMSYGVNSRVSNSGDTFRLHRVTYIKITIAGLSLKLYFALDPKDYKDSTLPIQDAGHKGIYSEIPLVFKVKSGLSMRRCKQLIQDVFDKNGLEQGEIGNTNWVEELKNVPSDDSDED